MNGVYKSKKKMKLVIITKEINFHYLITMTSQTPAVAKTPISEDVSKVPLRPMIEFSSISDPISLKN